MTWLQPGAPPCFILNFLKFFEMELEVIHSVYRCILSKALYFLKLDLPNSSPFTNQEKAC